MTATRASSVLAAVLDKNMPIDEAKNMIQEYARLQVEKHTEKIIKKGKVINNNLAPFANPVWKIDAEQIRNIKIELD